MESRDCRFITHFCTRPQTVTAKGARCACRRRENHCAPSVPPGRGSEVQLLPSPRFPTVRMTQRVPRRDRCKGYDEVAKRRGKGVRQAEKRQVHSYQKQSEKANPPTAFTAIALLRQMSHAVWERGTEG